jgi:release factor glutamine methyltransferase
MNGSIEDALATAKSRLSGAQSDAEELLGRLLGLGRTELYLRRGQALAPEHWERLESWLRRRARGEPVQYITGRAAFRGLDLRVTHDVLVPARD